MKINIQDSSEKKFNVKVKIFNKTEDEIDNLELKYFINCILIIQFFFINIFNKDVNAKKLNFGSIKQKSEKEEKFLMPFSGEIKPSFININFR